jgi:pentatricopeptide repeat protein
MRIDVYQRIGELYCLEKMFSEAIDLLNKALDLSMEEDERKRIKKTMADCYASQGDLSKGLSLYEEMLKNDPENDILKRRIESLKTQLKVSNSVKRYRW